MEAPGAFGGFLSENESYCFPQKLSTLPLVSRKASFDWQSAVFDPPPHDALGYADIDGSLRPSFACRSMVNRRARKSDFSRVQYRRNGVVDRDLERSPRLQLHQIAQTYCGVDMHRALRFQPYDDQTRGKTSDARFLRSCSYTSSNFHSFWPAMNLKAASTARSPA